MANASPPTILIVDDDPQVLNLFERMLEGEYTVEIAESGEVALDLMGDHVDACLIDRRMPGLAGEDIVDQLRESGYSQPVALVTAVDPDFDILKIGFDDYIVKPVSTDDLRKLVKSLVLRHQYDDILREYFALASKVTALQGTKPADELASSSEYGQIVDTLNTIKQEAKDSLDAAMDAGLLEELLWESFLDGKTAGNGNSR